MEHEDQERERKSLLVMDIFQGWLVIPRQVKGPQCPSYKWLREVE